ncbi:hypothetical protein JNW91_30990 [Micromonospora sp. STR1_7]|uniref:RIP homotypic interaction motif-containing protein n=1 Tax=Micromonospora parastrephiae TaxID=2806101 RepID=A0ABS1Y2Q3_9ACTN|nr:hypothetical protein [Micromonospora parastrephiae]MBM0235797.1 hypothetical protein [Micromonospora parastrephiae]
MDPEITALAATVTPYVATAVGAYGAGVVARLQDVAADATVGLGGRLLRRLLARDESAPAVEAAVTDLAEDPSDEDRTAALRLQIGKVLAADAQVAADVSRMLASAGVTVTASGERSVAANTISGVVVTGDGAQVTR